MGQRFVEEKGLKVQSTGERRVRPTADQETLRAERIHHRDASLNTGGHFHGVDDIGRQNPREA